MLEVVRTVAADLLELPEEASKMMGQALNILGDAFEKMAARIDALEKMVQGNGSSSGS